MIIKGWCFPRHIPPGHVSVLFVSWVLNGVCAESVFITCTNSNVNASLTALEPVWKLLQRRNTGGGKLFLSRRKEDRRLWCPSE